jgi:hypothetical protein
VRQYYRRLNSPGQPSPASVTVTNLPTTHWVSILKSKTFEIRKYPRQAEKLVAMEIPRVFTYFLEFSMRHSPTAAARLVAGFPSTHNIRKIS